MTDYAQSTTARILLKVYLSGTGTDATGKTVVVTISKNGGSFGNPSAGATNATEIANGWYYFDASTTDTGTIGALIVRGAATGCDNSEAHHDVVSATNGRLTALPATACTGNASLLTSGTGTAQISVASGIVSADAVAISGDTVAADNLEFQFDGTGLTGDTYPASQLQLDSIANTGAAAAYTATTYVLTTGTQTANTYTATRPLDGLHHTHTDTAGVLDLYYQFNIGTATPTSVTVTGYLNSANDSLEIYGYDWVSVGWVQIGTMSGKGSATNDVNNFTLFVDMVGTGGNAGLVRIRFTDGAFTLTSATLAIDQIFVTGAIVAITQSEVSAAVWNAATASYGSAGSYGLLIETNVDAAISAIKTKTDSLTFTIAGQVDATASTVAAGASNVKKNTALSGFMFVMTDSTTHIPQTGLTVTATRAIDGAAFASCTNSAAELASGVYKINLSAGDLNGNNIMLKFTATGADVRLIGLITQP